MKNEMLTPKTLLEYNEYFTSRVVNYDIFAEFLDTLYSLIEDDYMLSINERLQSLLDRARVNSKDESLFIIEKNNDFSNSVISFLEYIENKQDDELIEINEEFYNTFLNLYGKSVSKLKKTLLDYSENLMAYILNKYKISPAEKVEDFLDEMDAVFGKEVASVFFMFQTLIFKLITQQEQEGETEVEGETEDEAELVQGLYEFYIGFVLTFNRVRKNELQSGFSNTDKKIGRNDPCPCGSGKKYKKCCM